MPLQPVIMQAEIMTQFYRRSSARNRRIGPVIVALTHNHKLLYQVSAMVDLNWRARFLSLD